MKSLYIPLFILVAASILLSSCSQLSISKIMANHYKSSNFIDQDVSRMIGPITGEAVTTLVTGISAELSDNQQAKDSIVIKYRQPPEFNRVAAANIISNRQDRPGMSNDYTQLAFVGQSYTPGQESNQYRDLPTTNQPLNYSNGNAHGHNGVPYWLIVVCAIVIPPVGVALMYGITDKFWICLLLTLCFWLPGMIYALIQVL
jgi:uncharacterized membrane protein YqaE (UPF0057 family)